MHSDRWRKLDSPRGAGSSLDGGMRCKGTNSNPRRQLHCRTRRERRRPFPGQYRESFRETPEVPMRLAPLVSSRCSPPPVLECGSGTSPPTKFGHVRTGCDEWALPREKFRSALRFGRNDFIPRTRKSYSRRFANSLPESSGTRSSNVACDTGNEDGAGSRCAWRFPPIPSAGQ